VTMLEEVRDFAQVAVDAIAAVIGVEVAIVDENLATIAGSGRYGRYVGRVLKSDTVSARVLAENRTMVVQDPPHDELCMGCSSKESCTDSADIITPLVIDGKPAGCMLLVACTEDQKRTLVGATIRWVDFLEKMTDLIARAFNEKRKTDQMKTLAQQFDAVIDSVKEGILTLDSSGIVIHTNRAATALLLTIDCELVGKAITHIFPEFNCDLLKADKRVEFETHSVLDGEKAYWLCTMSPMAGRAFADGFVLSFRGIDEIPRMVANYMRSERQFALDDILGSSSVMAKVKGIARSTAAGDSTILIQGESGTGKELFARAIHFESTRQKGPFVAINCAAIPEAILESELFGYEEGAFTGARRGGKPGKFELSHGGTLFLDEIGDLPLHLQAKLLRAIEERQVDRLGGRKPIPVNIRIIAATNRDLVHMASLGQFRLDLYYRVAVIPIIVPPLREHREDIPEYVLYFAKKYSQALGKRVDRVDPEAMRALIAYSWPGNIRELANALEYAVNLVRNGTIGLDYLPAHIGSDITRGAAWSEGIGRRASYCPPEWPATLADQRSFAGRPKMSREDLQRALDTVGRSTSAKESIARAFGVSRATLYRRLREYGL